MVHLLHRLYGVDAPACVIGHVLLDTYSDICAFETKKVINRERSLYLTLYLTMICRSVI